MANASRVGRWRPSDGQTGHGAAARRPSVVHDLNCHLDFIKDKRGGEGDGHANEGMNGGASAGRHASSSSSSSNMRINGRVAENVHEYNRWPDGERERERE